MKVFAIRRNVEFLGTEPSAPLCNELVYLCEDCISADRLLSRIEADFEANVDRPYTKVERETPTKLVAVNSKAIKTYEIVARDVLSPDDVQKLIGE